MQEETTIPEAYQEQTWGKFWTYALLAAFLFLGWGLTWYLVEERRDANAEHFYRAGQVNNEIMRDLYWYAYDMPEGPHRDTLVYLMRRARLITTRGEMRKRQQALDSLEAIQDSIRAEIEAGWVRSGINLYENPDAASVLQEALDTVHWYPSRGARVGVSTEYSSHGMGSLEIRAGSQGPSVVGLRWRLDPELAYQIEVDAYKGTALNPYIRFMRFDYQDSTYTNLGKHYVYGNGFNTYSLDKYDGEDNVVIVAGFDSPNNDSLVQKMYLDRIRIEPYDKPVN